MIITSSHSPSGLNRQLTMPLSIFVTENPTGPSSTCPVERVAVYKVRPWCAIEKYVASTNQIAEGSGSLA